MNDDQEYFSKDENSEDEEEKEMVKREMILNDLFYSLVCEVQELKMRMVPILDKPGQLENFFDDLCKYF